MRKNKQSNLYFWLVLGATIAAVGLFLRPLFAARSVAADQQTPVNVVSPDSSEEFSGALTEGKFSQTINEVTVSVDNFRLDGAQLLVDLCFDMIDNRDWSVWEVYLDYGDQHITTLGGRPIELRRPAVNGMQQVDVFFGDGSSESRLEPDANNGLGLRCDQLSFDVQPVVGPTQTTLVIESIAAYPREGEVCEAGYLDRLNRALDGRAPGLSAECFIEEYEGGGGSSGLRLANWPASMSREEAEAILYSQDIFLEVHGIRGPWVFTVEIQ